MGRVWFARMAGVMVMLVLPAFGFSYASLTFSGKGIAPVSADDSNGDNHSGCHEGSKGRGAGGNDKNTSVGEGVTETCDGSGIS